MGTFIAKSALKSGDTALQVITVELKTWWVEKSYVSVLSSFLLYQNHTKMQRKQPIFLVSQFKCRER